MVWNYIVSLLVDFFGFVINKCGPKCMFRSTFRGVKVDSEGVELIMVCLVAFE